MVPEDLPKEVALRRILTGSPKGEEDPQGEGLADIGASEGEPAGLVGKAYPAPWDQ